MDKTIISEGKTTNEAIEKGLKQLKVSRDKVEIKVLENEEKRSFFSILAPRVVKVEIKLKEEKKEIKTKKIITLTEEQLEKAEQKEDKEEKTINKLEAFNIKVKDTLYKDINENGIIYKVIKI